MEKEEWRREKRKRREDSDESLLDPTCFNNLYKQQPLSKSFPANSSAAITEMSHLMHFCFILYYEFCQTPLYMVNIGFDYVLVAFTIKEKQEKFTRSKAPRSMSRVCLLIVWKVSDECLVGIWTGR